MTLMVLNSHRYATLYAVAVDHNAQLRARVHG